MTLFGDFVTGQNVSFQRARNALRRIGVLEGIVNAGDYAIGLHTPNNMSVDVAVGEAWVQVDSGTKNGIGHVYSDAVVNVPITAAHATLPRVDRIVLQWNDSAIPAGVGGNVPTIRSVDGVATSGATLANLTGAAAEPNDSLTLGFVLVPAAAGSVNSLSNIGGYIEPGNTARGAIAGAPPAYALGRPSGYVPSAEAGRSTNLSVPNNVQTTVPFDAENFDTEAMHDNVTNNSRLTIKTPGMWQVLAGVEFQINTGKFGPVIIKNGVNLWSAQVAATSSFNNGVQTPKFARLGYGDFLELGAYQISTTAALLIAGGNTFLTAVWEGI